MNRRPARAEVPRDSRRRTASPAFAHGRPSSRIARSRPPPSPGSRGSSVATEQVGERLGAGRDAECSSRRSATCPSSSSSSSPSAGEVVVAQTSIIGVDLRERAARARPRDHRGRSRPRRRDHALPPAARRRTTRSATLLASFLIVIVGIAVATKDPASGHIEAISIGGAIALLITYAAWLVDYLRTPVEATEEAAHARAQRSRSGVAPLHPRAVGRRRRVRLATGSSTALTPAMDQIGVPKAFRRSRDRRDRRQRCRTPRA